MGDCNIGFNACVCMGHFANDFGRSCKNEEKEEAVLHLLGTYRTLCQRSKRYLRAYIDDLGYLS